VGVQQLPGITHEPSLALIYGSRIRNHHNDPQCQ
jgi:hypothetical protein